MPYSQWTALLERLRALYRKSVQLVAHKDARGDAKTQVGSVLSQKKIFCAQ